jgi:hypothetical protein
MATPWSVPRMWGGKTVAILASGPSMSLEVAQQSAKYITIAVNDTFELAPHAVILYAADRKWWEQRPQALKFPGLKVTVDERTEFPEVLLLKRSKVEGFDPDPGSLCTGGNSGYQAVHLAIHAGATRILLCGFDMKGAHYFGKHKGPLVNTDPVSFEWWKNRFPALKGRGAEIINCSPNSSLQCFPFGSLSDG